MPTDAKSPCYWKSKFLCGLQCRNEHIPTPDSQAALFDKRQKVGNPAKKQFADSSGLQSKVTNRLVFLVAVLAAGYLFASSWPELPPGVPRVVYPDGSVSISIDFTTKQYQQEALRLILREANQVAKELKLPESLPITEADVKSCFISPFGYAYSQRRIGNITTAKYSYGVEEDGKFSMLTIANYDRACFELGEERWLTKAMNTNAPYQLATQWLAALSIDVRGLNRNCRANVSATPFWNGLEKLGQKPKKRSFVPIYFVWWTSPENIREGHGDVAFVELHLPTKTLLQLSVDDARYILRKPLPFTNLASLFPGTAPIFTNHPVEPEMVNPPGVR